MTAGEPSRLAAAGLRLTGAAIWVALIGVRLAREDRSLWLARDDGVITLSHARNLVEFGSIGVSPVGDRVEGYSSPLHLGIAIGFNLVRTWDAAALTIVIMVVSVAVSGWCVADLFLSRCAPKGRWSAAWVVGGTGVVALIVAASWSATGWMGSGMENPVVVAAGLAITAAAARAGTRWRVYLGAGALAAFAVSRVELAALAIPIGLALLWAEVEAAERPRRAARIMMCALGGAAALVGAIHLWRRWYFGEWLPNTAVAQVRFRGGGQLEAIVWLTILLSLPALAGIARRLEIAARSVADGRTRVLLGLGRGAIVVIVARLFWLDATGALPGDAMRLAAFAPVLVLCTAIVLVAWVPGRRGWVASDWVVACVALAPMLQYLVMGPARMEEFRVTSLAVPALAVLATCLYGDFVAADAAIPSGVRVGATRRHRVAAATTVGLVVISFIVVRDGPRYLQWEIAYADTVLGSAERFADERLAPGIVPILANPDLGKVSYAKSTVIVDLGLLGDPALAALANRSPEQVDSYLTDVAVPDVVELHGSFTCRFEQWVTSGAYVRTAGSPDPEEGSCDGGGVRTIWHRAGGEQEWELAVQLAVVDDPAVRVAAEIDRCRQSAGDAWRCGYVRRSVLRAAVLLRADGVYDDVISAMSSSPSWDLDEPSLRRWPGWGDDVADAYLRLGGTPTAASAG